MRIPKSITKLIESFERLPGIGPKTAQRLVFNLLHFPESELARFAEALTDLKTSTRLCSICKNVSENEVCSVCSDSSRDKLKILVVSQPMDSIAVEKTGFSGVYHVLHGIIDPLNNVGPEEIFLKDLFERIENLKTENSALPIEVILATGTSMEGEATSMYISKALRDAGHTEVDVKITRIARGLPVGGDIEYADDVTLSSALDGRSPY